MADDIGRALDDFASLYGSLPSSARSSSDGPAWGPREALAHLAFWHEQYAAITEALARGAPPPLLEGTFKAWNARAVVLLREETEEALLARLREAQRRLLAAVEHSDAAAWSMSFRRGSKPWPMPRALELIAGHIRLHASRLRGLRS